MGEEGVEGLATEREVVGSWETSSLEHLVLWVGGGEGSEGGVREVEVVGGEDGDGEGVGRGGEEGGEVVGEVGFACEEE